MQLLFAQGHPGSPNKIVDQLDRLQQTRPPGQTTCGQLPEIAARRVRSRLPPPPSSPADARTSGALGRGAEFFRGFERFQRSRATCRVGETRPGAAWGPVIVSRARFGGPGVRGPCTTAPCQSSGPRSEFPGWIPRRPGICRFKHFSHRGGRAHGTFHRHPGTLLLFKHPRSSTPSGVSRLPAGGPAR